ncbi:AAA family ATPase [Candidatus Woesearchaeota archaeon]|nr:AAA family ATPase [Candidatus Woesearchaeota archaeon]
MRNDLNFNIRGDSGPDEALREVLPLYDENQELKRTILNLKTELNKFSSLPLVVCTVDKILDNKAIIRLKNGHSLYVHIAKELEGKIEANDVVLTEQKSFTIISKVEKEKLFNVEDYVVIEKPKISWKDIGGLKKQIQEIKEVIELPMTKPELFKKLGVKPHKGLLLYGLPGTGKTLVAKAAAASTNSTFIELVGSELVQKYIGEGAKLVKDLFKLARERAPAIIFIDELDSISGQRTDDSTSGEREVQRTFMQLLAEIDGFEDLENVKIIGATNRIDIIDPAILRPGRLDRVVEMELPDKKSRTEIFKIHIAGMKLAEFSLDKYIEKTKGLTGAEIKSICTEAGYSAIRRNAESIEESDFEYALNKLCCNLEDCEEHNDSRNLMFG